MRVAVIDDSKTYLKIIKNLLLKSGIENFYLFDNSKELLKAIQKNFFDIIIIDYEMPDIDGLSLAKIIKQLSPHSLLIMLTASKDENLKEKALNLEIDEFINKDISFAEFKAKINMLKKLITYKDKLKQEIKYKEYQENLTKQKQSKIIKNELFNFFEDNIFIESFYKPKDILSGDIIFSKYINKHQYFLAIIDAMGKGVSASLTSTNAASFLEYALNKAIEYNDFNFERLVRDFVNYVKSILLDEEILCANIVCIKEDKMYFANFAMPPIYSTNQKFLSNNPPITKNLKEIYTQSHKLLKNLYILSDGILESTKKENLYPYYIEFREKIKKETFLKPIIKDFEEKAIQEDDISIIHIIQIENIDFTKNLTYKIETKTDINNILSHLHSNITNNKINYILHELLTNTYTHSQKNDTIINIKLGNYKSYQVLYFEEDTDGFNIEILNSIEFEKYHGKGFKIVKNLSEAMFFNKNGNKLIIFLKD